MKVLHFIPNFADINESVGLQYKIALIKAMAESAEVHLLCADYPGIDMGSVHVHKFSLLKNLFGRWHFFLQEVFGRYTSGCGTYSCMLEYICILSSEML